MRWRCIVIGFGMLLTTLYGVAQSNLCVQLQSDDLIFFHLQETPVITYTDKELIIKTAQKIEKKIPLEKVKKIAYNSSYIFDDILTPPIGVYTLSGEYVTTLTDWENMYTLHYPAGTYILKSQRASLKIRLQ